MAYLFTIFQLKKFIKIIKIDSLEITRFHLLHEANQLHPQGPGSGQRQQKGHQQGRTRRKTKHLQAGANEQCHPKHQTDVGQHGFAAGQGQQGQPILFPGLETILHQLRKGQAAEHRHRQPHRRQSIGRRIETGVLQQDLGVIEVAKKIAGLLHHRLGSSTGNVDGGALGQGRSRSERKGAQQGQGGRQPDHGAKAYMELTLVARSTARLPARTRTGPNDGDSHTRPDPGT